MDFKNFNGSFDYYHKVKTVPAWFYEHCRLGGFNFYVKGTTLTVSPAHAIDEEMADLIKRFKFDLIGLLNDDKSHKEFVKQ